jgi:hypothetical protein
MLCADIAKTTHLRRAKLRPGLRERSGKWRFSMGVRGRPQLDSGGATSAHRETMAAFEVVARPLVIAGISELVRIAVPLMFV